jgi:hypothetical protein
MCVGVSCDAVYLCVRSEVLTTVAAEEYRLRDGARLHGDTVQNTAVFTHVVAYIISDEFSRYLRI